MLSQIKGQIEFIFNISKVTTFHSPAQKHSMIPHYLKNNIDTQDPPQSEGPFSNYPPNQWFSNLNVLEEHLRSVWLKCKGLGLKNFRMSE